MTNHTILFTYCTSFEKWLNIHIYFLSVSYILFQGYLVPYEEWFNFN